MAKIVMLSPGQKKANQERVNKANSGSQSMSDYMASYGVKSDGSYTDKSTGRYYTTVTESDGKKSDGYIKDGVSYYTNGTPINAGASVTDSTGKTWTKGGNTVTEEMYEEEDTYNPYEERYNDLKKAYEQQEALLREQNRLAVEQGTNRLNAQKTNINRAADENARQAYVQYMQSQKALPQQLASQGVSGGATETANLGIQTAYQNNINTINKNKANRLQEIDNAIVDLQNTGDLSTVEQVLANNQAALDAYTNNFDKGVSYNQWAQQFNANRQDTTAEQAYRDQIYKDQMAQQDRENQWYEESYKDQKEQQKLENQWYKEKYDDAKKQQEVNTIISLLENGMYNPETAAAALGVPQSQLQDFVDYIKRVRALELSNQQSLINNRNNGGSGGGSGAGNTPVAPYKSSETSIANYVNGQLGKNIIGYNETTKKYGLSEVENGDNYLTTQQVYNWYKDPIIQKVLIGIEDGSISHNEGREFLYNLGYSETDISRVRDYTFEKEGE